MKYTTAKSGFSSFRLIMALVIVGLIGVVCLLVYNNKQTTVAVQSAGSATNTAPVSSTAFINVIQEDGTITQEQPSTVAKNQDQIDILTVLHNRCTGSQTYITVNRVAFDSGDNNFRIVGKYAYINASVCDAKAAKVDDLAGSGAANLLHKTAAGRWKFDLAGQMAPSCSQVDGLGYPASLVSSCSDGNTSRSPK